MVTLGCYPKLIDTTILSWTYMIHQIWISRNEIHFNNSKTSMHVGVSNILALTKINPSLSKGSITDRMKKHQILVSLQILRIY